MRDMRLNWESGLSPGGRLAPGDQSEDRSLVAGFLLNRDERSFRVLYRRHSPALLLLILRLVRGDHGDAEDVLQSVWIRAVERLPGFRWESSLRTWLTGIAVNCARELMRHQQRRQDTESIEEADEGALPPIAPKVSRLELEEAIAALPDGYREVLVLHDIEGYTHVEIGAFLGIQSGTSKSQLLRARRAIRARLLQAENLGHA